MNAFVSMENFGDVDLVIDVRRGSLYALGHLPNAVSAPVINDANAFHVEMIGYLDKVRGIGVMQELASININRSIEMMKDQLFDGASILLCGCDWGDTDVDMWRNALSNYPVEVKVLAGGYLAYSAWLRKELGRISKLFKYNVISGSAVCGKTDVLRAIRKEGGQIIDTEELVRSYSAMSAKGSNDLITFELIARLKSLSHDKPVWIEYSTDSLMDKWLPEDFKVALKSPSTLCLLSAPMKVRVKAWAQKLGAQLNDPDKLVTNISDANCSLSGSIVSLWHKKAQQNDVDALLEDVMGKHYDARYTTHIQATDGQYGNVITMGLASLNSQQFHRAAKALLAA